jgi:uncharacterized protein YigE (DUF2233 family)
MVAEKKRAGRRYELAGWMIFAGLMLFFLVVLCGLFGWLTFTVLLAVFFYFLWRWKQPESVCMNFRVSILLLVSPGFFSGARAVEFSTVEIAGKRITVCRVDVKKERSQLLHRDENGQPFKRFPPLVKWLEDRGQTLTFAMNAGMYERDYSALGVSVADGKELTPLNTAIGVGNFFLKPNGVFLVSERGARVVETSEYPRLKERVLLATQSGPLLVRNGRMHPAFKEGSGNRLFRNGVGVPSLDVALFAISEAPMNFHEFATMFRDVLHCPDALFLDGTVSSLHAPKLKRSDFRIDLGPFIGVTEPLAK